MTENMPTVAQNKRAGGHLLHAAEARRQAEVANQTPHLRDAFLKIAEEYERMAAAEMGAQTAAS